MRKPSGNSARSKSPPPPSYEPTALEREAARRILDRKKQRPNAPRFKVKIADGTTNIEADHPDIGCGFALLCDALATGDATFANGLLGQIANAARTSKDLTTRELNFMLATVREIGPRDPTETLLAVQMAAIHNATLTAARRLNHVENIPQQDSASTMLNKLARTFAAQVEALKKYRSTGDQNIKVQHVSVNANQAVVGINQGGGGTHEPASQSHALGPGSAKSSSADAPGPALLGHEQAIGMPMPCPSREGAARVQNARGEGGGT